MHTSSRTRYLVTVELLSIILYWRHHFTLLRKNGLLETFLKPTNKIRAIFNLSPGELEEHFITCNHVSRLRSIYFNSHVIGSHIEKPDNFISRLVHSLIKVHKRTFHRVVKQTNGRGIHSVLLYFHLAISIPFSPISRGKMGLKNWESTANKYM